MKRIDYRELESNGFNYYMVMGIFVFFIMAALAAAHYMETEGHHVTGMTNQIVWGIPHVFAVFLIVAASGALNIASISSVFGKTVYKPLAPLSGLLAIALLIGGLCVLVLDLGRPDRLIVAMTHYNFKSIFAWNILLYTGFIAVVFFYLWFMMEARFKCYSKWLGLSAFAWRLILTTGTGSIFGFLVARQAYNNALFAPMFIAMSFAFGLAIFILVLMAFYSGSSRPLGDFVLAKLRSLLGVFIAGVLYFVLVYHITNFYVTEHHGVERFVLFQGGVYTQLFWIVQILVGSVVPLVLLYYPETKTSRVWLAVSSSLVILGGLAQIYIFIIGGQAYPLHILPEYTVKSSFFDGMVNSYVPTLPEFTLGIGGIFVALLLVSVAVKLLKFLPESLADSVVDPHYHVEDAPVGHKPPVKKK